MFSYNFKNSITKTVEKIFSRRLQNPPHFLSPSSVLSTTIRTFSNVYSVSFSPISHSFEFRTQIPTPAAALRAQFKNNLLHHFGEIIVNDKRTSYLNEILAETTSVDYGKTHPRNSLLMIVLDVMRIFWTVDENSNNRKYVRWLSRNSEVLRAFNFKDSIVNFVVIHPQ